MPNRFDDGLSGGDFVAISKAHFKQCCFEAVDLIVTCIHDRLHQPHYQVYRLLDTLLIKACKQEELDKVLDTVCEFYEDDFRKKLFRSQLQTLRVHLQEVEGAGTNVSSMLDVKRYFLSLSKVKPVFSPKSNVSCN